MEERWNVPGKYFVSPLNFADEVLADYEFPKTIDMWDCTILKLDITPGARIYSVEEKVEIAAMLDDIGIAGMLLNTTSFGGAPPDMDHPVRHKAVLDGIRGIAAKGLKLKLCGFCRFPVMDGSYKERIDRTIDLGINLVYLNVPPQWRWPFYLPDWPWEKIQEQGTLALEYVKSQGVEVGISCPDIVRMEPEEAVKLWNYWADRGADALHSSDSYGNLSPQGTRYLFKTLSKGLKRKVPLVYHVHNDFGMATAQTVAAAAAGASPQASVNGIGDRTFASLDEVVLSLELLYGAQTGIKLDKLTEISQLVERITGIKNHANKPVAGEANYVPFYEQEYVSLFRGEPPSTEKLSFLPEMVGLSPGVVWWDGMLSAKTVKAKLEQMGLEPRDEHIEQVKETVEERLRVIKEYPFWIPDEEVEEICRRVVG